MADNDLIGLPNGERRADATEGPPLCTASHIEKQPSLRNK